MTTFRQGQNVTYIHPKVSENRPPWMVTVPSALAPRYLPVRASPVVVVDPATVSKPTADATRARRNLAARINRSAIVDTSAMKG